MSKNKCFIDTNIWLYAFIESQNGGKHKLACSVIKENEIIITTQVINEICVNLLKKVQFSEKDIQELVVSLYEKYLVLDIEKNILLRASKLRNSYTFSFWDSMIVASALLSNANILYSEDMQNNLLVEEKLTIVNPFKVG